MGEASRLVEWYGHLEARKLAFNHAVDYVSRLKEAELANTTPLQGTAPYALARAVDRAARRHGMRGCIGRVDYSQAVRLRRPFVAFMNRPGVGGHALCVLKVDARLRPLFHVRADVLVDFHRGMREVFLAAPRVDPERLKRLLPDEFPGVLIHFLAGDGRQSLIQDVSQDRIIPSHR